MNSKVIMTTLLALPGFVCAAEDHITETSALIRRSQPPETNSRIATLINKHIRTCETTKLNELLTENPDEHISQDLLDLARQKQQKSEKHCCRNLAPLLSSGAGSVISIYLSMLPDDCRPFSAIHFPFYIFFWMTTGCMTAHSLYSGFQCKKNWDTGSSSKTIVEILEKRMLTQRETP